MENQMDDYGFKFKIGDIVTNTTTVKEWEMWHQLKPNFDGLTRPGLMTIVERVLLECAAGIQRNYLVRLNRAMRTEQFTEVELCEYPWPSEEKDK